MQLRYIILGFLIMSIGFTLNAQENIAEGEKLFKANCSSCHTIGKGLLVGPDLKAVTNKYPEDWLIKWIRSSQTLVKSGDPNAVKIFERYNKSIMPDNSLSDEQIKNILSYIDQKGLATTETTEESTTKTQERTHASSDEAAQEVSSKSLQYIYLGIGVFLLIIIVLLTSIIKTLTKAMSK